MVNDDSPFGMNITMENWEEVSKNLKGAGSYIRGAQERHIKWAGPFMEGKVKDEAEARLKRRTGRYLGGIRHSVDTRRLQARIGTNVKYAAQREFGGVIKPKNAKWLTIPLKAAKTRVGVSRKARDYYDTFFHRTKDGRLFIFGSRTKKGGILPLFRLVKRVEQKRTPKGLIFGGAFEANVKRVGEMADRRVALALNKAFGKGSK